VSRAALTLLAVLSAVTAGRGSQADPPVVPAITARAEGLVGSWHGEVRDANESTGLTIRLWKTEDGEYAGLIELPDVDVYDWPAIGIEVDASKLEITLPSFAGPHLIELTRTGPESLDGVWLNPRFEEPADIHLTHGSEDPEDVGDRWEGTEEIVFYGGAGKLAGSLVFPAGDGPFPAAVFVQGSGPIDRLTFLGQARALAEHGIASLIFDKRGSGESEGVWITADLQDLAGDVIAAAIAAGEHTKISADRVGFIGHSQGGWVAPLAASEWGKARFIVSQAGPATTVAEETWWNVQVALKKAGYGEDIVQKAIGVLMMFEGGIHTGNWKPFEVGLAEVKEESWYEASLLATFDRFRRSEPLVDYYRGISTYDPMPVLSTLETPLLSLMGDRDEEQPWDRSQEIYERLAEEGRPISVHVYENVNHSMMVAYYEDGSPVRFPRYPVDFFARQATFINLAARQGKQDGGTSDQ